MGSAARVSRLMVTIVLVAGAPLTGGAGAARAAGTPIAAINNATVKSFDGTPIVVNFFPAAGLSTGETAPTVLEASGWLFPAYPAWLANVGPFSIGPIDFYTDLLGPATLIADGYNVVTWDNRGTFASGGQVNFDSPYYEGRDVSAIINWLATLPGVRLKGPNDPVVGMTGAGYGGGIQLSAAAMDHRLAAIEPNMSWYSLVDSLAPNQVIKQGWGNILCWTGELEGDRYAPYLSGLCGAENSGDVTPAEIASAAQASPGPLVSKITTPTLLLGGTVDTLFPLNGDIETYEALRAAGTPVRMIWYCGGYGNCESEPSGYPLPAGPPDYVTNVELAFLDKYLKGENVSTGPGFQYLDDTGTWHSAPSYPVPSTGQVSCSVGGTYDIHPSSFYGGSVGGFVEQWPIGDTMTCDFSRPSTSVETLSDPELTLTYKGTASPTTAPIYAELNDLDIDAGAADHQATPINLTLDGRSHTITVPLNMVVWNLTPSSTVELLLDDDSNMYFEQLATGEVQLDAHVVWPTSVPGPTS